MCTCPSQAFQKSNPYLFSSAKKFRRPPGRCDKSWTVWKSRVQNKHTSARTGVGGGEGVSRLLTKAVQGAYKIHKISALGKLRPGHGIFFHTHSFVLFMFWVQTIFLAPFSGFVNLSFCFCQLHMWSRLLAAPPDGGRGLFIMTFHIS